MGHLGNFSIDEIDCHQKIFIFNYKKNHAGIDFRLNDVR